MESKRGMIIKILIGVILILAAAFAVTLVCTLPVYPQPKKDVGTLADIQNAFKDNQQMVIPDVLPEMKLDDNARFELLLNGNSRTAKPIGYNIRGYKFEDANAGYKCNCVLNCMAWDEKTWDGFVGVDVSDPKPMKDGRGSMTCVVKVNGYQYDLMCEYTTDGELSEEEIEAICDAISEKLNDAGQSIAAAAKRE